MLSDHEREALADIEDRLLTEDPRWTSVIDATSRRVARQGVFVWAVYSFGLLVSAGLAVLMVVSNAPGPALFFATVTGVLIWFIRRPRAASSADPDGSASDDPGTGSPQP